MNTKKRLTFLGVNVFLFLVCATLLSYRMAQQKHDLALSKAAGRSHAQSLESRKPNAQGYIEVSFDELASYKYEISYDDMVKRNFKSEQIPNGIKALNGKKVMVEGYMVPTDGEGSKVSNFILLQNTMSCCFGVPPPANGWIDAAMIEDRHTKYYSDEIVQIYGTLEVGEVFDPEKGLSIYRMQVEKLDPTESKKWFGIF